MNLLSITANAIPASTVAPVRAVWNRITAIVHSVSRMYPLLYMALGMWLRW